DRPQLHAAVTDLPGELDAGVDKSAADSPTARSRIDDQQPQLRRSFFLGSDTRDGTHASAVDLRDPRRLSFRVVTVGEVGDDPGHQPLVGDVPAVLLGVELAIRQNDPAEVARFAQPADPVHITTLRY